MRVDMDSWVASSDRVMEVRPIVRRFRFSQFALWRFYGRRHRACHSKGPGVKPGPGLHKRARRAPDPPFLVIFLPGLVYRSVISVVGCVMEMISNPLAASSSMRAFSSVTDRVSRSRE